MKIIGPFKQIVTLRNLSLKGTIKDESLEIINDSCVAVNQNHIVKIASLLDLQLEFPQATHQEIQGNQILLPSFVDCHTHICFGGKRAADFAMRLNGKSYLEIANAGGGIWSTVQHTRSASQEELVNITTQRANKLLQNGITTIEVKSGYGLDLESEIKMLQAIVLANTKTKATLIPTFLGAHIKPKDFSGSNQEYLDFLLSEVMPKIQNQLLCKRADIFVEQSAFGINESKIYLQKLKQIGFDLTVHADQFSTGGSELAVAVGAKSADHLEASTPTEVEILAKSQTVAVALPGASIGLGEKFTPARQLLDAGACLAIASDYNPGSAPMGDLLTQASILATSEKLSTAEVLAGVTFRAAQALNRKNIGRIEDGFTADLISFPTDDFRDVLYHQGQLKPNLVWKAGKLVV